MPVNQPCTFQNVTTFINHEATAGLVLALTALAAIIFDNTAALAPYCEGLPATPIKVQIGNLLLAKPLILWINDGLMAIFLFLVELEIKREVVAGYLILRFAGPNQANRS